MSELKFRAWDKNNKRWVQCAYPLTGGIYGETSIIGVQGDEDEDLLIPDDVDIVWYIGLKDKNGKESYHKDILRNATGLICTIEYGEYRSRSGTGFGWYLMHKDGETYMPFPYDLEDWEVIGTVYENKELLG